MSVPDPLVVLLAVGELVGVSMIGLVVVRVLRRYPVAVPLIGVLMATVVAMVMSTVVLLVGVPRDEPAAETIVVCATGLASVGVGLLLGRPVLERERRRIARRDEEALAETVDEAFALSRMQVDAALPPRHEVALPELIGEAVAGATPAAAAWGVRVWAGWIERSAVVVDGAMMTKAITGLLVTAAQCSREGGTVSVDVWVNGPWITVSVRSERSPGPPPARSDPVRADQRGTGLRLAAADGIVRAHRGELAVHNQPDSCRFEVWLPVPAAT
ncbi:sensor histidine kinase [Saccharopolyspora sp. MS10]|uniref:sensor histidine kinase n=1 Tax=Saccharopolyspora sp. MS10 TaxID=3385973 RepID=UPI0039A2DCE5